MTTKVTLVHSGPDVVYVEAFGPSTLTRLWTQPKVMRYAGDTLTEYVHSGQSLVVREQTLAEKEAEMAKIAPPKTV